MRKGARSVVVNGYGGVDNLEVIQGEIPAPGPGEVLVKVVVAGINHIDAFIRQGKFRAEVTAQPPHGQGTDFAGIVVSVGSGVTSVKAKTDVIGHAVLAAQADYVVVPESFVIRKPDLLDWEVAGGLYLASVTAEELLRAVGVGKGDVLIVSAAAGAVGSLQIQLARARGATVIGTCSARNFDYLRSLGVTPVLYGDGIADRIRQASPTSPTAYIDNYGSNAHELAAELGISARRVATSDDRKALEVRGVLGQDSDGADMRIVATIAQSIADHQLSLLISGFYPMEDIQAAYDDLEKLHSRGKVVIGMEPVNYPYQRVRATGQKARDLAEQRP